MAECSVPVGDRVSASAGLTEKPAVATETAPTDTTPSAKGAANNRRKSGAGVPEHKKKTPNKKKSAPELRLNVSPGEMYLVSMRGFPPWPVIIADDDMLPENLLIKRPVSARRIDGTYREDFADGGKHVKDRRYPVMFLGTNEFSWEVNTALQPLDIEAIKAEVAAGNTGKKKKIKALWEAYVIASEEHDLQYFKDLLDRHEKAMQVDAEEKAAAEAKKLEAKEKKKTKRKSTAAAADEDVTMEDAGAETPAAKPKGKKRKKEDDGEDESEKPAKTPKTKLKLTNTPKEPSTAEAKPKKAKKAKAKVESESESSKVEEKPMTEEERREKQEKSVLYLRHRLQKGFISRDHPPKEEEMPNMSEYLKQLDDFQNLEAEIIKKTKVHKVLKAILKLDSIPMEEVYNFKKRSADILQKWSGALQSADVAAPSASAPAPATNGDKAEAKSEPAAVDDKAEKVTNGDEAAKGTDGDGDVSMADAKTESPAVEGPAADVEKQKETAEVAAS
ncbi:uncharacterized protein EI97DRAFT_386856 [Westerdykella ornata]|uniref:PWWP domain-containing protein n=1 Tax=Westerdykella ornata TaxID=318751 RepID=A0A6A6J6C7_WESOR|nr:uncharacterized protein EI97DRAFT_386856 [Westerdykella ornata]KAF2271985.1 hypothetical protein EI97DRAFT_386856 [Westerdykella ornata]